MCDDYPFPRSPSVAEPPQTGKPFTMHIEATQTLSELWKIHDRWDRGADWGWIKDFARKIGWQVATALENTPGKLIRISLKEHPHCDAEEQSLFKELEGRKLYVKEAFVDGIAPLYVSDFQICTLLVNKHSIDANSLRLSYLVKVTSNMEITILDEDANDPASLEDVKS